MPATAFDRMPDDARLWVFAAPRDLTDEESGTLLRHVDEFLARWAAHGAPVLGARDLRHARFLLVAADERATGVSGCSIDSMTHTLGDLERLIGTGLRSAASLVFWRDAGGHVRSAPRAEFRALVQSGEVTEDSVVFDNTVPIVGDVRGGRWETRFRDSWHARAFAVPAATAS